MSNEMYYQTLDNSGIKYPNGKVNLYYQVEHSFEINDEWIYEMMMNDKDVVNSKFYELIKDKKVRVVMGDGNSFPTLMISDFECTIKDYEFGSDIEITDSDLWYRLKRILFGSHFEGDVRELVKEHWYFNEPMSEKDLDNGKRLELEIEVR